MLVKQIRNVETNQERHGFRKQQTAVVQMSTDK
jgi:hypothetical protein